MSLRTYFLYIALALLIVILIGVLTWPFLHVEKHLQAYLLDQLSQSFSGEVHLKSVYPAFFAVRIHDLEFKDRENLYTFHLKQVKVNFNAWRFLTRRFNVIRSISSLSLISPEIVVQFSTGDSVRFDDSYLQWNWDIFDHLPDALWIPEVKLTSGSFQAKSADGTSLFAIKDLNGDLLAPSPGLLKGRMVDKGKPERGTNAILTLLLDRQKRIVEASLTAEYQDLRIGSNFGLPDSLEVSVNQLKSKLRFWVADSLDGLEGDIQLSGLHLSHGQRSIVRSDSLSVTLGGWKAVVSEAKATGLTADWSVSGEIPDIRNPELIIDMNGYSQESSSLGEWIPTKLKVQPSGKLQFNTQIRGKISAPNIRMTGVLEHLSTGLDDFSDLRFSIGFNDSILVIHSLESTISSGKLHYTAKLTLPRGSTEYGGFFTLKGPIPGLKNSATGIFDISLRTLKGNAVLDSKWTPDIESGEAVEIESFYSDRDDRLQITLSKSTADDVVEVVISNLFNKPTFHLKFDRPVPIIRQFIVWSGWDRIKEWHFSGEMSGNLKEMSSEIEVYYAAAGSRWQFKGKYRRENSDCFTVRGDLNCQRGSTVSLPGTISLRWETDNLILENFDLDDAIFAQGSVNLRNGELGLSELRISNWDVSEGVQLFSSDWAKLVGGILDGRMEIYGTITQPTLSINGYISKGHFRDQKEFWAVVSAELDQDVLQVSECNIGQGVLSLLKSKGILNLKDKNFDFQVTSNRADISDFLDLFKTNPLKISGPLTVNANLSGSLQDPDFRAEVQVLSGKLYKIPFEKMEAEIKYNRQTDNVLRLDRLSLIQAPDLALTGSGSLPLTDKGLDVILELEGNILKIPKLLEKTIPVSQGQGKVTFHLDQEGGKIRLRDARLTLQDGWMKFLDVVDEIQKIQAEIHLDSSRVIIDKLSGIVDRQEFNIGNFFLSESKSEELEHLFFPGIGIDLGIVTLETKGRGIFTHIPSLMPKRVKGYLLFRGKKGENRFTFSGPINQPLFRGNIEISDAIFIYPSPQYKKTPSPFVRGVLSVLNSARWDVDFSLVRGNRYEREFKTQASEPLLSEMSDLLTTVDVSLSINPDLSSLSVRGRNSDKNLRLLGSVISTRGTIEYLDMKFNVERFAADFDLQDPLPYIEGKGQAVYLDSLGQTRNIYLTLYVIDPVTGERTQRGRWGDFVFIIEDDEGSSQEQILAAMGYSPEHFQDKMTSLTGQIISDAVLRRWIRPIERELETILRVDFIRLQPTIAQHLFEAQVLGLDPGPEGELDMGAYFLRQSQFSVGKYFGNNLFLTYTGRWDTGINAQNERHYGFIHRWSLEYRFRPISNKLVLDLGYEYDSLEQIRDREIAMRYTINF